MTAIMATLSSSHSSSPPLSLLRFRPVTIHQSSTTSIANRHRVLIKNGHNVASLRLLRAQSFSFRKRCRQEDDQDALDYSEDKKNSKNESSDDGEEFPFPTKMAIALGIATAITLISIGLRRSILGWSLGLRVIPESSSSATMASSGHVGFSFNAFGHKIILPEYPPGWIYFWLLMAAGFGLFVSEEALNIWVGISLSRKLCLDGTWMSFSESFSKDAGYVVSTILWVYWGVCISDMVPFYFGKLFRKSGASDNVYSKLGVGGEKASLITQAVQKYGNLIGFVERFSLGVRNPTSFLAGASGISAECYFAGVCFGGLITLPIQLGIGFLMRERPLFALATVAMVVGIWTVFPYALAALTALFLFVRRRYSS